MTWYLKEYDLNDWRLWKDIISSEFEVRMDLNLTLIPWNLIRDWDSTGCYYTPWHQWFSLHYSCYSNGKPDLTTKLCLRQDEQSQSRKADLGSVHPCPCNLIHMTNMAKLILDQQSYYKTFNSSACITYLSLMVLSWQCQVVIQEVIWLVWS